MENMLLDSSLESLSMARRCSKMPMPVSQIDSLRYAQQSCPVRQRGFPVVKASYSIARTSSEGIESASSQTFWENTSFRTNRSNGNAQFWISSRERYVLDAKEDEYGGIVIDPERLPWNADIFGSMLQASLSNWKLKVVAEVSSFEKFCATEV